MLQSLLAAICFEQGHVILWTDSTTTHIGAPPGRYICQRCLCEVVIERRTEEQDAQTRRGMRKLFRYLAHLPHSAWCGAECSKYREYLYHPRW